MKKAFLILIVIFMTTFADADSINLSTYYSAPSGVYNQLRLLPRADYPSGSCDIGSFYVNTANMPQYCAEDPLNAGEGIWGPIPGVWAQSGNNIFLTDTATNPNLKVGIGTVSPENLLHVQGSASNGYVEMRLENTSVDAESGARIVFEEGNQGDNLEIKYRGWNGDCGGLSYRWSWLEFWGLQKFNADYPIMTLQRDWNPACQQVAGVGIGVHKHFLTNAKLVVRSNNNGDILNLFDGSTEVMTVTDGGKVGIGTPNPEFKLTLDNDGGILAKGTFGAGEVLTTAGAGTRMIWYPRKAAFRAGQVTGSDWDDANIGNYSIAFGIDTRASGEASFAGGENTAAIGNNSIALGFGSSADDINAIAMGYVAQSLGQNSIALGHESRAEGDYSLSMGWRSHALGNHSIAFGQMMVVDAAANNSVGISLSNTGGTVTQPNTMAIIGGNVGIGILAPTQRLHVNSVMRIEPRDIAPFACVAGTSGSMYVDNTAPGALCFCNGTAWQVSAGTGVCS